MKTSRSRRLRRKAAERNALVHLAEKDPEAFSRAWRAQLPRWAGEARRRGAVLTDQFGAMPAAFAVVDEAMAALEECGAQALAREGDATRMCLTQACCLAVADAANRNLNPATAWDRLRSRALRS